MKKAALVLTILLLPSTTLLFFDQLASSASNQAGSASRYQNSPAPPGSGEPNLWSSPDGGVLISWVQDDKEGGSSLYFSSAGRDGWEKPLQIAAGENWFVNWADFPSVVGTSELLAAHWLDKSGAGTYAYDVKLALSRDGGRTWGKAVTPHRDGTQTEHGFVSLLPWQRALSAVWLDGRNTGGGHEGHGGGPMSLRQAFIGADGKIAEESLLDDSVCDCCQTSAALTDSGILVAYRDRSAEEIRDIYTIRYERGKWSQPAAVAADNWKIAGCPVNGPAVDARGRKVALAWFTEANNQPRVQVAFSNDSGVTFGTPTRVDLGEPVGRVDAIVLPDGSALISWLEHRPEQGAQILVRRITPEGTQGAAKTVAHSSGSRASGFPRMVVSDEEVFFAWTEAGKPSQVKTTSLAVSSLVPAALSNTK